MDTVDNESRPICFKSNGMNVQYGHTNERTLLFIDAIHIDDDKRLLISSHMFALCFTDSVSWLEF